MASLKVLSQPVPIPLSTPIESIKNFYPEPCLFEIPGVSDEVVFVGTLLHGNEHASFEVLKFLVNEFCDKVPSKTLLVLVGNVEAAALNKRLIVGQQDYNRIWKSGDSPEHHWAEEVKEYVRRRPLFACIDVHNNSGKNPFYSCISELTDPFVYLASLFSSTVVYFRNPDTVLSTNFSQFGPSLTIECGESGNAQGVQRAKQLILDILSADSLSHGVNEGDIHIFQTVGRIVVDPQVKVAFGKELGELHFPEDVESLNFYEQEAGTFFCRSDRIPLPLQIFDPQGEDLIEDFCVNQNGALFWRRNVIPSMFTRDTKVIAQDCFGYVMRRVERSKFKK